MRVLVIRLSRARCRLSRSASTIAVVFSISPHDVDVVDDSSVHHGSDFILGEGTRVDSYIIDGAREFIPLEITPSSDVRLLARAALAAGDCANKRSVVQLTVQIDVQRSRIGVINTGHV